MQDLSTAYDYRNQLVEKAGNILIDRDILNYCSPISYYDILQEIEDSEEDYRQLLEAIEEMDKIIEELTINTK